MSAWCESEDVAENIKGGRRLNCSLVRYSALSLQKTLLEAKREMNKTEYLNLTQLPEEGDLQFKWLVEGVLLTAVALTGILGNLVT